MTSFHHSIRIGVACCVLTLALVSQTPAVEVKDAAGRNVVINDASRIVSIGGAVTEILYALGMEDRVIAIDSTSLYPQRALATKKNVGYMRQLSPEGVLGLSPTLVLAAEGSGPKEAVGVLQAAAVPFVSVPDHFTGEGIVEKIRLIADATGVSAKGECLAAKAEVDLSRLSALRKKIASPAHVIFVLSLANGRAMVAGRGTAADGIIRLAGGVNAAADFDGYKPMNEEAIVAAKPDAILAMEREGIKLAAADVFSAAGFALTPAASRKAFISMEGLYLLGFGPRTTRAARDLAHALYPEIEIPKLPSEEGRAGDACGE